MSLHHDWKHDLPHWHRQKCEKLTDPLPQLGTVISMENKDWGDRKRDSMNGRKGVGESGGGERHRE